MLLTRLCLVLLSVVSTVVGQYTENLVLESLPHNSLLASFNFRVRSHRDSDKTLISSTHYAHLPRSLGQILANTNTHELHLRLTQGRWDDDWGSLPSNGEMAGGTGMEIWAWIDAEDADKAYSRWIAFTNALAGLFCASLNFVDSTRTISPALSFQPSGDHPSHIIKSLHLFHGALPREPVCTENLTPFLKLLPCKGRAGISSLLDGHRLFDSQWQAMALDVQPICEGEDCFVEMVQNVDAVIDVERSIRRNGRILGDFVDLDSPIPRPRPRERLRCDTTKVYAADDVCFPLEGTSQTGFTLEEIFGRPIRGVCPVSQAKEQGQVHLKFAPSMQIDPPPSTMSNSQAHYVLNGTIFKGHVNSDNPFNLRVLFSEAAQLPEPASSPLLVSRWLTGHGQERGGIQILLKNTSPSPIEIVYLESLPWFMRPYLHTLRATISGNATQIDTIRYRPAIDRLRGTQLEVLLTIPAEQTLSLTWEFDKSILRYTEYPPDANRGFDVAPAIIHINGGGVLRTTSLLLSLPTPDFSMPYNVIILSSTVIALAFGSIFNLLVRRFVVLAPGDIVVGNKLRGLILKLILLIQAKLEKYKNKQPTPQSEGESSSSIVPNGVEK